MTITEIKRETAAILDWTPDTVSLAEEAETVLGYKQLKEAQKVESGTLAKVLTELGIDVLNAANVKQYQRDHLREVARNKFEEWMTDSSGSDVFYCPRWNAMDIAEYKLPVPEFVLNKAIQIKKAMPDAHIFIEHLDESPDPFLLVRTTQEKQYDWGKYNETIENYYVEVWDEPKFEGRSH